MVNFYFFLRAVIFRLGRILSGGARGPGIFFVYLFNILAYFYVLIIDKNKNYFQFKVYHVSIHIQK